MAKKKKVTALTAPPKYNKVEEKQDNKATQQTAGETQAASENISPSLGVDNQQEIAAEETQRLEQEGNVEAQLEMAQNKTAVQPPSEQESSQEDPPEDKAVQTQDNIEPTAAKDNTSSEDIDHNKGQKTQTTPEAMKHGATKTAASAGSSEATNQDSKDVEEKSGDGTNTVDKKIDAMRQNSEESLHGQTPTMEKAKRKIRVVKHIFSGLIAVVTNPIFWIIVGVLLIGLIGFSGSQVIGQSDFKLKCLSGDVAGFSMPEDSSTEANANAVARWLMRTSFVGLNDKPMTIEQASGVIGNFIKESGVQPGAMEGFSADHYKGCDNDCVAAFKDEGGKAVGIAQWDGARRQKFIEFCDEEEGLWSDFSMQLKWLKFELDGGEGVRLNNSDFIISGLPAGDYARIWNIVFERSADTSGERQAAAEDFFNNFSTTETEFSDTVDNCAAGGGSGISTGELMWPTPTCLNPPGEGQQFGWRMLNGEPDDHRGIDIGCASGNEIVAADGGTVIEVQNFPGSSCSGNAGWGNMVLIDHGGGRITRYAHMTSIAVQQGDAVDQGMTIGTVGNTGCSFGAHLHFEVGENGGLVDPMLYLEVIA